MPKFILGGHSLSAMFSINQYVLLKRAMCDVTSSGGTLFEIPFLLCKLPWKEVAQAANRTGIKEIALCHFWPRESAKSSACGDPLGKRAEIAEALATLDKIIRAAKILRKEGVTVRFIDGPTWGCLGWDYTNLTAEQKQRRVVSFLKKAGKKCGKAGLKLVVEFLRPHEDKVIGGTRAMIEVLERVNSVSVSMHFDLYHSIMCGEDPAESIRMATNWISYLHLHGDKRIAPGALGDKRNWKKIVQAVRRISSDRIPVVPEPFGEATCMENKALGEGLPIPLPMRDYLPLAYSTLMRAGLPVTDPPVD